MSRTVRYRDGTVRHIHAGPGLRRRRPPTWILFVVTGLAVVWAANHGVL